MLVDAHVHLYPDPQAGQRAKDGYEIWEYGAGPGVIFCAAPGDPGSLTPYYDDFDHIVVVNLADAATTRLFNEWAMTVASTNSKLTVLAGIDPSLPGMTAHLTEMAAAGARGIKLHPVSQGFVPNDRRLHPIYDLCAGEDLVVLSHSGPGHRSGASARPGEFAPVLRKWPRLRLVLAHLGGASWRESAQFAEAFPQVTFDLSEIIEWTGAPGAPSASELSALICLIGADRVMLGSDFPWYDPNRTADRVASLPGLGSGERAAILGETAARVFRL